MIEQAPRPEVISKKSERETAEQIKRIALKLQQRAAEGKTAAKKGDEIGNPRIERGGDEDMVVTYVNDHTNERVRPDPEFEHISLVKSNEAGYGDFRVPFVGQVEVEPYHGNVTGLIMGGVKSDVRKGSRSDLSIQETRDLAAGIFSELKRETPRQDPDITIYDGEADTPKEAVARLAKL